MIRLKQKSHNAQPVSQSTPVITGSLIDRLHAGTVFGGMGTTNTPTTVQVPLASNASSTPDAEHRKFLESDDRGITRELVSPSLGETESWIGVVLFGQSQPRDVGLSDSDTYSL